MAAPLFILSFRHRDELNRLAENAGWEPISARRSAHVEARFLASGAAVAVVDARGAAADGLAAVCAIGEAVEANAGALLVLLSRKDEDVLGALHESGATHFLVSPFSDAQLVQAFRFAARHAQRAGGERPAQARLGGAGDPVSWRWPAGGGAVTLNGALSRKAGLPNGARSIALRPLLRVIGEEGRRAAQAALVRLRDGIDSTAFAHADPEHPGGRIAHHVRLTEEGDLVGRSEVIAPTAGLDRSRDALTGVSDGRAARAWLTERLAAPVGGGEPGAVVLLLALSRFDAINLAFGRASGDAVLQSAARRIERLVDADGGRRRVARLAGAEFAVLLATPGAVAEARFLAGQVMQALSRPFISGDQAITIGSRAGIAVSRAGDTAASLLRRASAALADAKGQEGSPVSLIDGDTEHAAAQGDRLEIDLRRALNEDRIEMVFQPQVDIVSGRIVGVEALARWNHPDHGELGAATLFGVAERSDYLVQLSAHVQRKALHAAAAWPATLKELRVAVNVTAQDIVRPGFAEQFLAMVAASGLEPERVTVEVTESGLMEDLAGAAALLSELRRGGLRVAIDDFGTGYSSLAYLRALPLDYLKLDKRLCEDITGSARDRVVVSSVIDMAGSLGLEVIAEGVETSQQLDLLAAEGCSIVQGFLFSPPITAEELARLVAAGEPSREAAE